MRGVILVKHGVCNVGHISTRITLASDVDLVVADIEDLLVRVSRGTIGEIGVMQNYLEVFEEVDKLLGWYLFVGVVRDARRESHSDGILDPKHIGQVDPRVWVDLWSILTPGPLNQAILLEKAFQRAAACTGG